MILYEYEGKDLLQQAGINVPQSQLVTSATDKIHLNFPVVLKAQVLSGKRAASGGILVANSQQETVDRLKELFEKTINKERVEKILVEEKIEFDPEIYLSISYDTDTRSPLLTVSTSGGTGVEKRKSQSFPFDILNQQETLFKQGVFGLVDEALVEKLVSLFVESDLLLLEINPLVKTKSGDWMALDSKIKLDDTALGRHEDWKYLPRSVAGYSASQREIEAKKIDEGDYRGTAGSTYFDFDGDIAILASGGGASLTAMDALIKLGGKPANYTEYSGNPPKEKVVKLTKIVLSKPSLNGLWVVGAYANFTDIYETLSGFIEGLREAEKDLNMKFKFPIVIRRGGPRFEEAFAMLKKVSDFDLHLFGPDTSITQSAKTVLELSKKFAQSKLIS